MKREKKKKGREEGFGYVNSVWLQNAQKATPAASDSVRRLSSSRDTTFSSNEV